MFPKNLRGCGTCCPGSGCVGLLAGRNHAAKDITDDIVMASLCSSREVMGGVAVKVWMGGALVVRKSAWCFGVIATSPCVFWCPYRAIINVAEPHPML